MKKTLTFLAIFLATLSTPQQQLLPQTLTVGDVELRSEAPFQPKHIAALLPARASSELDAAGQYLAVVYDPAARLYIVEEDSFSTVKEARAYVATWIAEVTR